MTLFLVFGFAVGYALIYSGLTELNAEAHSISTVEALLGPGKVPGAAKPPKGAAAAPTGPTTPPRSHGHTTRLRSAA